MITVPELKKVLHRDIGRLGKLLIILSAAGKPAEVAEIRRLGHEAGLRAIKDWNISQVLRDSKGKAILTAAGWELTDDGRAEVAIILGIDATTKPAAMAVDLRAEMVKIKDPTTLAFVEEAIRGYENRLYRSAIVMSWLAAVDVIYHQVVANKLAEFNAEATRVNSKWRPATNRDGLAMMSERDFLDRTAAISVIGKSVKTALIECLDRRNGCGHPNSLKIGDRAVAHHIETLIQNVFQPFT